jgi:hypothetical protein
MNEPVKGGTMLKRFALALLTAGSLLAFQARA